ncbi:MAG: hypothetical protein RMK29_11995 [Myxococcales bacterium]|nr:hypothetical protein [Myxococcota bacterium]MDW8282431.1 hypothetical protein [Myxococcales bacterium]
MGLFRRRPAGSGLARRLCQLERSAGLALEPLGLLALDFAASAVLPCAPLRVCFHPADRPSPACPVFIQERPSSRRALYLCTPSEAAWLAELCLPGVGRARVCGPAAAAALLVEAASALAPGADAAAVGLPCLPWVEPWPRVAVLASAGVARLPPRSAVATAALVPLGLLFDPPGVRPATLARVMSDEDLWRSALGPALRGPLAGRCTPLLASLLLPLRRATWRAALRLVRDEVGRRLRTEPGWYPILPEELLPLCRRLDQPGLAAEPAAG